MIKQLTGGDAITYRQLYKDPITYVPQYNLFIQCNEVPMLSKPDGGIQRRLEILEFPFQFVAQPTMAHERQGDPEKKSEIMKNDAWRDEFFWMLVDAFKSIGSLWVTPEAIKTLSSGYIDDNNPVANWLAENYERTTDAEDHSCWQVATALRDHYNEHHDKKIAPKPFTSYMNLMKIATKEISAGTKRGAGLEKATKCEKVWLCLKKKAIAVEEGL
jgi:putative DNA primase/helicase